MRALQMNILSIINLLQWMDVHIILSCRPLVLPNRNVLHRCTKFSNLDTNISTEIGYILQYRTPIINRLNLNTVRETDHFIIVPLRLMALSAESFFSLHAGLFPSSWAMFYKLISLSGSHLSTLRFTCKEKDGCHPPQWPHLGLQGCLGRCC